MTPFAVAGIQMFLTAAHENLQRMQQRLAAVMQLFPWVQMAVFSELAACGPYPERAQTMPGPAERAFREMARKHGIWLIPGSIYEERDGLVYNTTPVIDPSGEVIGRYRKIYPFLPYEEGVEPGSDFLVFDIPGVGRFGLSICYDMWFPETSRTLAAMGAEVILHPSLTGTIDRDVEVAIARATAACNQCYVIDINGVGAGGSGRSTVVGPEGAVLYRAGTADETIPLELDLDRVRRSREAGLLGLGQPLKSFRDRKLDYPVYRNKQREFLNTLGPLQKPERGALAGLGPESVPGHAGGTQPPRTGRHARPGPSGPPVRDEP